MMVSHSATSPSAINKFQAMLLLSLSILFLSLSACKGRDIPTPTFAADVHPILKERCAECHLPGGQGFEASGFSVESFETVMRGTRLGPVIQAGESISSTLIILIDGKSDPSISMPHGKEPLTAAQVQTIKAWVNSGAVDN